ncbi:uncharacterized protein LOC142639796 [Castanea sativa]|uniref:uncharacterized protein LOC142639796 n=1 Tax=Castanea sativa TaxID=21020 RepID=UPI003F64A1ED
MDKCLPFFKILKQAFTWTEEYGKAFQELKYFLSNPTLLSSLKEGENLFLYLAVSAIAVSAALIYEENKVQLLVYYVSQAFQGAEAKYPQIEKIVFALIIASCKLRPYFQANPILALADFLAEFIILEEKEIQDGLDRWTIQTDGSSTRKIGEVGVIVNTHKGDVLRYGVQLQFPATNNEAEYEAILTRLKIGKALRAKNLHLQSESKLVIGHIKGEYEAKEDRMQKYLRLMNHLTQEFD